VSQRTSEPDSRLTYREYAQFPSDGRRHEVIDGEHHVNPAPETYHQTLSRRIPFALYVPIEAAGFGVVFDAPTDLQLSAHDIVQLDLIVVLDAKASIVTATKILGTPDLIVEILSPSTASVDRGLERELYCRSGVPEYWIVDPTARVVEQLRLDGDSYAVERQAENITFRGPPAVTIDLRQVW